MLSSGARLGPYEVLAPLGAGGMGEVYRARDTKLGRDVALKVLPEAFTSDPDRLARFEREAKVLASLNHPHIGQIYGLEEGDGQKALVLELVEGPTLADRIAQGPIALDEALPLARQIAEALEAAHEQGIIHRDLKPVNVKVRPDGTVKVLDFGLAKAYEPEGEDPDASHSPTLTARATQAGVILGTAAYMSPEQARGKPVDKRADIWAFGALFFEMLTGQRAFVGGDVTDTLASVLRSEPEWAALPVSTPPRLRHLLRRCLEKVPRERLRDIGDARLELQETSAEESATAEGAGSGAQGDRPGRAWLGWLAVTAGLALVLGIAVGRSSPAVRKSGGPSEWSRPPTWTVVNLPESAPLALGSHVPLVGVESRAVGLSPDGRHLVYVAQDEEGTRLYHRDLTVPASPRPLAGTEGALFAFFSPDSSDLGFLTADRVRKTDLRGGPVTTLCRARVPVWASWVGDTIYFGDSEGGILRSVAAEGGEPDQRLDVFDRFGYWANVSSVLPNGRGVLVQPWTPDSSSGNHAQIRVVSLEVDEDKPLGMSGYGARYLPSGHLVFARGGALMAAPFDLDRLEVVGDAFPVMTGVAVDPNFAQVHAAFADNGTVAYVAGGDLALGRLAWVDRQGGDGLLDMEGAAYQTFDLSPDERKIAVQVSDVQDHVWVWDAESGGRDLHSSRWVGWPVWGPDGSALVATASDIGSSEFQIVRYDLENATAETLLSSEFHIRPESWVEGEHIGFSEFRQGGPRVGVLSARSPGEPTWIHDGGFASVSPDGAWIGYAFYEATGGSQVWLEEIGGDRRRQVSTDGGLEPVWCRSCCELFYRHGNRILASRIVLEPELEIGPPRLVFEAPGFVDTGGLSFRVSSNGQRMYYVKRSEPPVRDRIHIVHNFFTELERLAPTRE